MAEAFPTLMTGVGVIATILGALFIAFFALSTWLDVRRRRQQRPSALAEYAGNRVAQGIVRVGQAMDRAAAAGQIPMRAPTLMETAELVAAAKLVVIAHHADRGPAMHNLRVALRPHALHRIEETMAARRRA